MLGEKWEGQGEHWRKLKSLHYVAESFMKWCKSMPFHAFDKNAYVFDISFVCLINTSLAGNRNNVGMCTLNEKRHHIFCKAYDYYKLYCFCMVAAYSWAAIF